MTAGYNSYPLYTQSGQLTFRSDASATTGSLDPFILRGKRSMYRPSLPTMAEILMLGAPLTELKAAGYMGGLEETLGRWAVNMVSLSGTNIDAAGAPGMIGVLPAGNFNYTMYEDEVFEPTKFSCSTTTKTIATSTITLWLSATAVNGYTPVIHFNVGDLVVNWSDTVTIGAEPRVARVVAVDTTGNSIGVQAFDSGSSFSSETDFCTTTTAADLLEIVGNAQDFINASPLPSAFNKKPFRRVESSTNIKTYNLQAFTDVWEIPKVFDGKQRPFGDVNAPQAMRNKLECFYSHLNKISRALLWGDEVSISATANNISTFKGLNKSISTNVTDLTDGALALSDIDRVFIEQLGGTHSSNLLYGFCSLPTLLIIEQLYNTLGSQSGVVFQKLPIGAYSMEIGVVRYRGRELHLIPAADFMNQGARTFVDQTTDLGAARAGSLFFVDPQAVGFVVGSHQTKGTIFFDQDSNVQTPEESYWLERNVLRTMLSFYLRHEKTSAKITNIRVADLNG